MKKSVKNLVVHTMMTKVESGVQLVRNNTFLSSLLFIGIAVIALNAVSFKPVNGNLDNALQKVPTITESILSIQMTEKVNELVKKVDDLESVIVNNDGKIENLESDVIASPPIAEKPNDFSNIAIILNAKYFVRHGISNTVQDELLNNVNTYVSRYLPIAKIEQNLYGIPTSITLAQGLLESDAGGSRLARKNNNHFGIKCFSKTCTKGHCTNYTDDSHKDFFVNYESAWLSYRAHSDFLRKPRYKDLLKLKPTDYKGWANGLRKAGYATDKRYAEKLISIIEKLGLAKYD